MKKYHSSITDELIQFLSREQFGDYFSKLHRAIKDGQLRLNEIETLLKYLCDERLETEKTGCEDWKYIGSDKAYEMGIRCVFNELKKLLSDRQAILKDGVITTRDQSIDLDSFETHIKSAINKEIWLLQQTSEFITLEDGLWDKEDMIDDIKEFEEFIKSSIQQLYQYKAGGNIPIYKLLECFKEERALATFAVISYISERLMRIHSEDDIRNYYMIGDTPEKIIKWVDRYTTGDNCFTERAAAEEICFYEKAREHMKKANSFTEYIIGAIEANFWLQNSLVLLGTSYRVLTNQSI